MRRHLAARYARPFDDRHVARYTLAGTPEAVADRVAQYVEAGVRHFVLNPAGPPGAFLEEVRRLAAGVVHPIRRRLA
jgi:alkanesulfonate monooxygenase SsuD/methylene tetrahydromethanopterin reductase-like flavin-dependent oxidoreductase (luciferase family)